MNYRECNFFDDRDEGYCVIGTNYMYNCKCAKEECIFIKIMNK